MTRKVTPVRNKSPPVGARLRDLETILDTKPSVETDLMLFLKLAGMDYFSKASYGKTLCEQTKTQYERRRATMSRKAKVAETRFVNAVMNGYYGSRFKTIQDLKQIIENEGLTNIRDMGYWGLAQFNRALEEYGIEPIKLGGGYVTNRFLKRYGLKISGQ